MAKRRSKGEGSILKLKNCRYWYASFYDSRGRQVRVSTKETVKQKAFKKLRDLMSDSDRGLTINRKMKYADLRAGLLANYVERGNKSLITNADGAETLAGLTALDKFFGYAAGKPGTSVTRITTDTARTFVRQRQAEGAGNAVINRSLAALRRMFRIAQEDGKLQFVPVIRLLKEPPARKGFLPLDKFEELVGLLPTTLRPLVTFLYFCGVRVGEALQIEWDQVDLKRRLIRLEDEQTKSGEARIVPLPSALVMMLQKIQPKEGKVFTATNLRKEWQRACAVCRLGRIIAIEGKPYDPHFEGLNVHDLRRSAIRNLVNAGVPELVAMKISGHKTRSVFDRYHIVSTDDVTNAMRRLEVAAAKEMPAIRYRLGKVSARNPRKSLMALSSRG
jgi:integrase